MGNKSPLKEIVRILGKNDTMITMEIEKIKELIRPILREHEVKKASLFGSIVKGEKQVI